MPGRARRRKTSVGEFRVANRFANIWLDTAVGGRSAIRRCYLLHSAFDHSRHRTPIVHAGGYSQIGLLRKNPTTAASIPMHNVYRALKPRESSVIARCVSNQIVERFLDRFVYGAPA
jgi:hypothetical protein